jgi:transcriptional regulator with PAS, ATPase and Fis domain
MNDSPPDSLAASPAVDAGFRWSALFQRAVEPHFILNRRRQILFVNRAWENLTGWSAKDAHKRVCKRQRDAAPGSWEAGLHALCPPRDVLNGKPAQTRRVVVHPEKGPCWWEVQFTPIKGPEGILAILGKIVPIALGPGLTQQPLPEKLMTLRQQLTARHRLEYLGSEVPAVRRVAEQVRLASRTQVPVLISGEPGSGKQWLARTIHQESDSREAVFFALDCQHLPLAALAWALFGPPGLAQRDGATLYLREPSRLPREIQARLCEMITAGEEGRGPRLMAGCSAEALDEVRAGRLLEELHCLLSPLTIHVPPLRERLPDLPALTQQFLERLAGEHSSKHLSDDAWELIRSHHWPGNLHELYAVLAQACRRAHQERLEIGDLPWYLRSPSPLAERTIPLDTLLEKIERRLIQVALVMAKGNKSRAAEVLEIWRPRLLRRMEALGIDQG